MTLVVRKIDQNLEIEALAHSLGYGVLVPTLPASPRLQMVPEVRDVVDGNVCKVAQLFV